MGILDIVKRQLIKGFTIGIAGGIVAVALAAVVGMLPADAISQILISVGLLVLLIMVAAKTRLAGLNLYNFVVLLSSIAIVGSIFNLLLPGVSQFILSAPDFTVSGLLMSMIYIGLGIFALKKLGVKA